MSLTFEAVNNTIGRTLQARQEEMRAFTGTMDTNNTADLLRMQQMMQEWSMLTQLQSTLMKDIGDALKGIIQKSG